MNAHVAHKFTFRHKSPTKQRGKTIINPKNNHLALSFNISESCSVEYGVPQGTVLGPKMFTIDINSLIETVKIQNIK